LWGCHLGRKRKEGSQITSMLGEFLLHQRGGRARSYSEKRGKSRTKFTPAAPKPISAAEGKRIKGGGIET